MAPRISTEMRERLVIWRAKLGESDSEIVREFQNIDICNKILTRVINRI